MIVGRLANEAEGPYVDRDGKPMRQGGGMLVVQGDKGWYDVGHNAVYTIDGTDYLIYHRYDATDNGK